MAKKKVSFEINEIIVYPQHGVGIVEGIQSVQIQDDVFDAMIIHLPKISVRTYIPLDEIEKFSIRKLASEKEVDAVLQALKKPIVHKELQDAKNWKDRKKVLQDLFATGSLEDLATVVQFLYFKNQQKDLPNSESRIFDLSLQFLTSEIAHVKNISFEMAADHLANILDKFLAQQNLQDDKESVVKTGPKSEAEIEVEEAKAEVDAKSEESLDPLD